MWHISFDNTTDTNAAHIIDGLVQERHNYTANTLELGLSCFDPLMLPHVKNMQSLTADW